MVIVFDLDDTLYDEIDFVRSGFEEVASYLGDRCYFEYMWQEFLQCGSGKIFNSLIKKFRLNMSLETLIEIYRFHKPNIQLPKASEVLLQYCAKFPTALISDGHYIMQQNKFEALKLADYIDFPIFTHFYHTKKPELKPFLMVMERFGNEEEFVYIADNPKKDFIAPKNLGWKTIRFKNPRGIYKKYQNSADIEVVSRQEIALFL